MRDVTAAMTEAFPTEDPLLLIPGPSDVADDVLAEMARQVVPHYGPEWTAFFNSVVQRTKWVLQTKNDLFIYAGSGHLGLDAVIASLFEPGDSVVVGCNGYFGERLYELAIDQELKAIKIDVPWGEPLTVEVVESVLDAHPEVSGVLVVHGETSTGVENPVEAIANVVRNRGLLFVVDAVSSAGLIPLEVDAWGIDACVTASQKGLSAPPGVVITTVGPRAWAAVDKRRVPIRGWSTNLAKWREFGDRDYQPYFITMPVNVVRALDVSLRTIEKEGLHARFERHRAVSEYLRRGIRELGLEMVCHDAHALAPVTAFRCPSGKTAHQVRDELLSEAGVHVSPGLGPWNKDVVRVGLMGRNATFGTVERFLTALKGIVGRL